MTSDEALDFESSEGEDGADSVEVIHELFESLKDRCKKSGIEVKTEKVVLKRISGIDEDYTIIRLELPCGRGKRSVPVSFNVNSIERFLSSDFDGYRFISGYDAVYNEKLGVIEAEVRSLDGRPSSMLWRRLFGKPQLDRESAIRIAPTNEAHPKIEIGLQSKSVANLLHNEEPRRVSVRIFTPTSSQHDQAKDLLEKVTNSIFFQIDMMSGDALSLVRERASRSIRGRRVGGVIEASLKYPDHEYDNAPMSLYWYAKSAVGMPLLQFLAYYQAVEFFFPTYFRAESNRKIRSILRDPTFRSDRDSDLAKIISAIQSGRPGGGRDERSQLKATINECTTSEELREFIEGDDERKGFLSSKTKGLTDHGIPLKNTSADLRSDVAERIYDIRCKIVHTKGDGDEIELLLPFSKEAGQLHYDIQLIEYVARRVLITASAPISF